MNEAGKGPSPPPPPSARGTAPGGKSIPHESEMQVKYCDMPERMKRDALTAVAKVLWPAGEDAAGATDLEMAEAIKRHMDGRYPCPWHCVVGRKFGSYVTHHQGFFIYLLANHRSVLLFKST